MGYCLYVVRGDREGGQPYTAAQKEMEMNYNEVLVKAFKDAMSTLTERELRDKEEQESQSWWRCTDEGMRNDNTQTK